MIAAFPPLIILLCIWPGDWQQELRNLNMHIETENMTQSKSKQV
jgi:hypothetical protein